MRKIKLENEKIYHIYNRGANKESIFWDEKDYLKFLNNIWEFNNELSYNRRRSLKNEQLKLYRNARNATPEVANFATSGVAPRVTSALTFSIKQIFKDYAKIVEIICYSLLSNHYHFILKQLKDNGIENFMRKLGISYAKYFNHKYKHSGVIFQSRFHAYPINDENKLCQLSAYVNCNHEIHKLGSAENWQFTSYQDYLNLRNGNLCNKNIILKLFKNDVEKYKEYCELMIKNCQDVKKWQKLLMED